MELIIYVNDEFEEEKALVDLETKNVLLKGDYYHDKIDYTIEGYLEALKDFEIYTEEVEDKWIDKDHEMHKYLEFYEGD